MQYRYNVPPGWPAAPAGWVPPAGWTPDPRWPAPPPGWQFWVPVEAPGPAAPAVVSGPAEVDAGAPERAGLFGTRRQLKESQASNQRLADEATTLRAEVATLRAETRLLRERIDELRGMDALARDEEARRARAELDAVRARRADEEHRLASAHQAVRRAQDELDALRARVVQTEDTVMVQEAGIYEFRHRLAAAVAYKDRLDLLRARIRTMARDGGRAVLADTSWTVNGSQQEGHRMARGTAKLMLRAYNAEADNCVRTMRPHRLGASIERLTKSRETIARLGSIMQIRISDEYHRLRVEELELCADHLVKVEQEKDEIRAERQRQRDEAALQREIEREKAKLAKEDAHWAGVQAAMRAAGDTAGVAVAQAHRSEIADALGDVEKRAANVRAGYVYVISNIGAFGDRMVKIGMTRRLDPTERVRELGDASVPFRFDTHALIFSTDAVSLETRLHQELADRRVNRVNLRREFFHASPAEVLDVLTRIGGQHLLEYTEEPEAAEWRASRPADEPAGP